MWALVAVLLLTMAGCSGDDDDTERATPTTTSTSAPTTTSTTPAPATAAGDTGRGSFSFRTPSGNIWCAISDTEARCDITEKSWAPPPKPADCELDWGDAISVDAENAAFVCAGDTVQEDSAPVLPYGGVVERGDLRCRSEEQGVTCEHRPTGNRFLLSRQRYERA